jgi:hypothetical protein
LRSNNFQARVEAIEARIGNGGPPLDHSPDSLVPDVTVQQEFSIGAMSLYRWDHDPAMADLGWPSPIFIRKCKYRSRKKLEAFKTALVAQSIRDHTARLIANTRPSKSPRAD